MKVEVLTNGSILITRGLDEAITVSNAVETQVVQSVSTNPVLSEDQQARIREGLATLRDQANEDEPVIEHTDNHNDEEIFESNRDEDIVINVEIVQPAEQTILSTTLPSKPTLADLAAQLGGKV